VVAVLALAQTGGLRYLSPLLFPDARLTPNVPEGGGGLSRMAPSRPKSSLQEKPELSSVLPRNAVLVKLPTSRFVTFHLKDTDKTMRNISPFCIQKALDSISGKVNDASRLENGTVLVEARNDKRKFS
jgi:hypothetical protein